MQSLVLGIDPGKTGGLALLKYSKGVISILSALEMPTEEYEIALTIRAMIGKTKPLVFIEQQQAMPKQGVVSTFTLANHYGYLRGVCTGLGLSVLPVRPKVWQSSYEPSLTPPAVLLSTKLKPTKIKSLTSCMELFSKQPILTARGRWLDGLADSIMIAHYGIKEGIMISNNHKT